MAEVGGCSIQVIIVLENQSHKFIDSHSVCQASADSTCRTCSPTSRYVEILLCYV